MTIALITIFCTSFLIALSGALMPGPLLTVTVSESSRRGAIAGPLMIFGHGLLELVLITALLLGAAPLLQRNDVFIFISLVGGALLLWMGFSMLRSLSGLRLDFDTGDTKSRNLVLAGILFSLANPYWLLWWASIGLGYVVYSVTFGIVGVMVFFLGHILADLAWYTLISFGVARGRRFFSDVFYRRLIGCCASFLVLFSGYFFYSGFARIL
ncbi:MAG: LysE family translocator [Desulfobulbaceae bacterium]|nr:LysE family translocator [Desulfobulbaceae bacterium]